MWNGVSEQVAPRTALAPLAAISVAGRPALSGLPVFIINLDRCPERLAFMQAQAQSLGFNFERIQAIDGAPALPRWMAPQFVSSSGEITSNMSSGEVGCYASHLMVFARIVARKVSAAIVLEDDVTLDEEFIATAEAAVAAAPDDWDCVHLSTAFKNSTLPVVDLGDGRRLVRHSRLPTGAAAYAISLGGATKLLVPRPRTRPVDMEFRYAWLANLDLYGVQPSPAVQEGILPTTIDAPWRTKPGRGGLWRRRLPKPRWAPNLLSQVQGSLFIKRKLGLIGTLSCWVQDILIFIDVHLARRPHGPRKS